MEFMRKNFGDLGKNIFGDTTLFAWEQGCLPILPCRMEDRLHPAKRQAHHKVTVRSLTLIFQHCTGTSCVLYRNATRHIAFL